MSAGGLHKITFIALQVFHPLHNVRTIGSTHLLTGRTLADINRTGSLTSDDSYFLGGEAGTEQATGLYFLVGEDGTEVLGQASLETVV